LLNRFATIEVKEKEEEKVEEKGEEKVEEKGQEKVEEKGEKEVEEEEEDTLQALNSSSEESGDTDSIPYLSETESYCRSPQPVGRGRTSPRGRQNGWQTRNW
jgi:hypothetical protein